MRKFLTLKVSTSLGVLFCFLSLGSVVNAQGFMIEFYSYESGTRVAFALVEHLQQYVIYHLVILLTTIDDPILVDLNDPNNKAYTLV